MNIKRHAHTLSWKSIATRFRLRSGEPLSIATIWMYILVVFLVLGVVVLAWSVYLFVAIGEETIFDAPATHEQETLSLDRTELRETLNAFDARRAEFELLQSAPPSALDPAR